MNTARRSKDLRGPRGYMPAVPASSGLIIILVLTLVPDVVLAQRTTRLTGIVEVGGAIDDNPFMNRGGLPQIGRHFGWALTAYPSVKVVSSSSRSTFNLDYTLGLEQYESTLRLRSDSHRLSGQYQANLNARWRLLVSDSYTRSPDFSSFLAFRGVTFTREGILFDFSPAAIRRDRFQNNGNIGLNWDCSPHSSLSFDIRHSYQQYDNEPGFSVYSTGQTYGARAEFTKRMSERMAWTVGYNLNQFGFERFESSRNQDVYFGVEHEPRPSVSIRLKAGPSYAEALPAGEISALILTELDGAQRQKRFLGYNVDFNVTHSSPSTAVGLFYRRDNGMNSGIGSVSSAYTLGVDFSQKLATRVTARLTAIGYDYRRQLDNPYDYRGITATLQFDVALSRYSALTFGGSYHSQQSEYVIWNVDRRRLFFTLRFFLSDFLKGAAG